MPATRPHVDSSAVAGIIVTWRCSKFPATDGSFLSTFHCSVRIIIVSPSTLELTDRIRSSDELYQFSRSRVTTCVA